MAARSNTDTQHLDIPETIPVIGEKFSRVDFIADHRTPQGTLQLGRVCLVPKSGNMAEVIVLPVLFNKETGNRFASYGMTKDGQYRRNIQGITADSVEEYRAAQALAQGFVKAAVLLFFQPIVLATEKIDETPVAQSTSAAAAAATA
jgi:hypothetical protein